MVKNSVVRFLAASAVVALLAAQGASAQQTVPLTSWMVIDRSVTIRPGTYVLPASADLKAPAITIRGSNITVDFNGAVMAGGGLHADPDSYVGVGILIDGGSHVTVKNAVIRGYKVGILARLIPDGARRGRETIVVDEWGPYDWKSPKLWPLPGDAAGKPLPYAPAPGPTPTPRETKLRVLGPEGEWKVASTRGATVAPQSGRVGGEILVTPAAGANVDWQVSLEYRGGGVTSPRGAMTPAGQPYRFGYSKFLPAIPWTIKWFEYTDVNDPVKQPAAFAKLLAGPPAQQRTADNLHYVTGRSVEEGLPRDRVAMVAEGVADLPAGDYTLQVISDDGARVWMDGTLLLDAWAPHESRVDAAAFTGGRRRFKVEYYEIGGFAELRFTIRKLQR